MSEPSRPHVLIFTDGACSGNPGPGGWGAILRSGSTEKELKGGENPTTNNRMELLAAISALEALKKPASVDLTTDSQYVIGGGAAGARSSSRRRAHADPLLGAATRRGSCRRRTASRTPGCPGRLGRSR